MPKESILRELYRGNLAPNTKIVAPGSAYEKTQHKFCALEDNLLQSLNDAEKSLLHEFTETWGVLSGISSEESFVEGFRLGAKLMLEVLSKDEGQFKPIVHDKDESM